MTRIPHILPILAQRTLLSDLVLLMGIALVTTWMLMRYRNRRRKSATTPTPLEQVERMRQQRGMRGDLEQLMVEIEQLSKRLGAHLDAKAIRLEKLLEEADQRIDELDKRVSVGGRDESQQEVSDTSHIAQTPSAVNVAQSTQDPLAGSVYALADQGLEPAQIADQLGEFVGKVELILALRQA